jgi:[glutamine synthetase] adenylyltransferase / [glutamine synthetase]-adenylyl-L-tyrosine phosphorylase
MASADSLSLLQKNVPESLHDKLGKHWQSWLQSCEKENTSCDPLIDLHILGKIWACSDFVATNTIRRPQLWFDLIESKQLDRNLQLADYQSELKELYSKLPVSNDIALMQALRLFRQKHMIRIAWRDLCASEINNSETSFSEVTSQTLKELTDLAEACVDSTLEYLYQDQCDQIGIPYTENGEQQRLVVLGMGKLGGHELNFSSDIDLIFFFAEEGEIKGKRTLANSQFFTRLGQRFIKALNDITGDGFVFRVDMRLRPYGDSGPLVMSFAGMEQYYQTQGRDWERYAMIKARVIGGDRTAGKELMEMLRPFIYRRYLDFGAFESIREMKAMISAQIKRKSNENNIKLGEGGIREIEFIGQTFQLIRGGGEKELQIRSILSVLHLLSEKGYMPNHAKDELTESYNYLRRLENRLQMYADGQTHDLPDDVMLQHSITLAMGCDSWSEVLEQTDFHRQRVHAHFNNVFAVPKIDGEEDKKSVNTFVSLWRDNLEDEDAIELLQQQNVLDCEEVVRQLNVFKQSTSVKSLEGTSRQRLDNLMPLLLDELVALENAGKVTERLLNLLQAIVRRSVYLALLIEYPIALTQLVTLFNASPWVANLLTRYPILLDELLDPRTLYEIPTKKQLMLELDAALAQAVDDEELQMELLRKYKQAHVLRIAAMDIGSSTSVFDVSEQLTAVSEALITESCRLGWEHLVGRHGKPKCIIDGKEHEPTMAIVAYGKMGGRELSYSSDLDIVFLHDSKGEKQYTDGEKSLDNSTFFARLAQRVVHIISMRTANGRLYEVDTRLRPDGAAGMLVSSLDAFELYQHEKAWVWEHQALIRARLVVGNAHLYEEFDRIRRSVLNKNRDLHDLKKEVIEMRQKMRDSLGAKGKDRSEKFHLKQDAGGIVDIEFTVQYAVLANIVDYPDLLDHTATRQLLMTLQEHGVFDESQVSSLSKAYELYRSRAHQLALQEQSSLLDVKEFSDLRESVKQIWLQVVDS